MQQCDEQPPRCGGCSKRGLNCDYEELLVEPGKEPECSSLVNSSAKRIIFEFHPLMDEFNRAHTACAHSNEIMPGVRTEDIGKTNTRRISDLHTSLTPYTDLNEQDLLLLHHYKTIACHTLFSDELKGPIWQFLVPELACIYPFVMHNILSLAAIHLAYLRPDFSATYTQLSARHQSHVIKSAQARVASQEVDRENCSAVVICSSLLLVYELAILHPSYFVQARTATTPFDEIVQKMLVMRRLVGLWTLSMPLFRQGPARILLSRGKPEMTEPLASEIRQSLDGIKMANNMLATNKEEQDAYRMAIDSLWLCFETCTLSNPPDWLMGMAWPNLVPQLFMSALIGRKPLALAITAHYCTLLYLYPQGWWMNGWPQPVLSSLIRAAAVEDNAHIWKPLFSWPANVIGVPLEEGLKLRDVTLSQSLLCALKLGAVEDYGGTWMNAIEACIRQTEVKGEFTCRTWELAAVFELADRGFIGMDASWNKISEIETEAKFLAGDASYFDEVKVEASNVCHA
ncbi:hypothetical protein MferCBS31731_006024 [Microsporum ferrugineum]